MRRVVPYSAMPLGIQSELNLEGFTIHSLAQIEDKLVIIYNSEDKKIAIVQCQVSVNSGNVTYKIPESIPTLGFDPYYLESVNSIMGGLILFMKHTPESPGTLIFYKADAPPLPLFEDIYKYCVNSSKTYPNSLAVCTKDTLFIIDNLDSNNQLFNTKLQDSNILSVGLSYPLVYLVYLSGIMVINIEIERNGGFCNSFLKMPLDQDCSIIPADGDFILYNSSMATFIDSKSFSSEKSQVTFDETPQKSYYLKPFDKYVSVVKDKATFYDFEKECSMQVPNFSSIASVDEIGVCFYSSDKEVYVIKDLSDTFTLFMNKNYSKAFEMITQNNGISAFPHFFALLWNTEDGYKYPHRDTALEFLSVPEIQKNVMCILEIFGKIKFFTEVPDIKSGRIDAVRKTNNYYSESQIDETKEYIPQLLSSLTTYCTASETPEAVYFHTAILECYIILDQKQKVRELLKRSQNIDFVSIRHFITEYKDPELAFIISAYSAKTEEALEAFNSIENPTTDDIDLAFTVLSQTTHDWSNFIEHAKKFIKKWPVESIRALTTIEDFEMTKISDFIDEKFPKLKNLFLIYAIRRAGLSELVDRIVPSLTTHICESILNCRKSNFDISTVSWLKCVLTKPGDISNDELINNIEAELTDRLTYLISNFFDQIDRKEILKFANQCKIDDLKAAIHLADENYEEGLSIIWKNSQKDVKKAIQVCISAKDSSKAFKVFLPMMKESLSKDEFKVGFRTVLQQNADVLNPDDFVQLLDFDDINESFDYITTLYRDIMIIREKALINASKAESDEFEAEYQKMVAQIGSFTVDQGTLCTICHKQIINYFVHTPDEKFIHESCLASKPNH